MRWGKHQAIPLGDFRSPHECVNWNNLNSWSKERSVDVFAPGVLVHPIHGKPQLALQNRDLADNA